MSISIRGRSRIEINFQTLKASFSYDLFGAFCFMIQDKNTGRFQSVDITNKIFGKLTAIHKSRKYKNGGWYWICKCDCGNITEVLASHLTSTKSCGCLRRIKGQNKTHGLRCHPLYQVWRSMKYRCYNEKAPNYKDYGGRGITVCERWYSSFQNFYDDMITGYVKGEVMIDRIKVNENYEPINCRWLSYIGSANNKRNSKYLSLNGIVRTAAEWSRVLGIKDNTITSRKLKGYPDHLCLSVNNLLTKNKMIQNA